jgi:hypothetical protein
LRKFLVGTGFSRISLLHTKIKKVNSLYLIKHYVMKTFGVTEVQLYHS